MRKESHNKLLTTEEEEEEKETPLTPFEEEASRRFPGTARGNLTERMHARSRRRAKNKMRRVTQQKQR